MKNQSLLALVAIVATSLGLIFLSGAIVAGLQVGSGRRPVKVLASTPPSLPTFASATPAPTYAPSAKMQPGDQVTITDGEGKLIWVEYLGVTEGSDYWTCASNAPNYEGSCEGPDGDNTQFNWGTQIAAWDFNDQTIHMNGSWHITAPVDKPNMP